MKLKIARVIGLSLLVIMLVGIVIADIALYQKKHEIKHLEKKVAATVQETQSTRCVLTIITLGGCKQTKIVYRDNGREKMASSVQDSIFTVTFPPNQKFSADVFVTGKENGEITLGSWIKCSSDLVADKPASSMVRLDHRGNITLTVDVQLVGNHLVLNWTANKKPLKLEELKPSSPEIINPNLFT